MDPDPQFLQILAAGGVAAALLALAFTSAVDAAMTTIGRHRLSALQAEAPKRAVVVQRLLSDPYRLKAVVLVLNASALITASACTLWLVRAQAWGWQLGALALLLIAVMTFGEALPKALALRDPQATARTLAGSMSVLTGLLWPVIWVADTLFRPLFRTISGLDAPIGPLVTEEELRLMVNVGEEEGLIESNERDMIEGIFGFGDTLVREVMVPRVDIAALESDATLDAALDAIIASGHSRIPVFTDTVDQIAGVLYAKDIMPRLRDGLRATPIATMLREPYYVPDSMKVDALLRELQTRKVHLAIVVDEYGGTAGLVTIEDLLEEIVGDIQDEYDAEELPFELVKPGELLVDARVLLDDINQATGLRLSSEESDRVGGLVYERLGRVPQVGDTVQLANEITITVLSIEGLGPRRLRMSYPQPASKQDQPSEELAHHDAA